MRNNHSCTHYLGGSIIVEEDNDNNNIRLQRSLLICVRDILEKGDTIFLVSLGGERGRPPAAPRG